MKNSMVGKTRVRRRQCPLHSANVFHISHVSISNEEVDIVTLTMEV